MQSKSVYKIGVKGEKIISVLAPSGVRHFVAPVTKKVQKIYLVGKNGRIHYVGITKQSIKTRLRMGENPHHETGYHGYAWLKEKGDHCLVIFVFDDKTHAEAIEAEIVYLLRRKYNNWPKYQTEIHFHPTTEDQRKLAKQILKESDKLVRNFA